MWKNYASLQYIYSPFVFFSELFWFHRNGRYEHLRRREYQFLNVSCGKRCWLGALEQDLINLIHMTIIRSFIYLECLEACYPLPLPYTTHQSLNSHLSMPPLPIYFLSSPTKLPYHNPRVRLDQTHPIRFFDLFPKPIYQCNANPPSKSNANLEECKTKQMQMTIPRV